jgi:hypothetical protein
VPDDIWFINADLGRDDMELKEFKTKLEEAGLYFYEDLEDDEIWKDDHIRYVEYGADVIHSEAEFGRMLRIMEGKMNENENAELNVLFMGSRRSRWRWKMIKVSSQYMNPQCDEVKMLWGDEQAVALNAAVHLMRS